MHQIEIFCTNENVYHHNNGISPMVTKYISTTLDSIIYPSNFGHGNHFHYSNSECNNTQKRSDCTHAKELIYVPTDNEFKPYFVARNVAQH